MRLSQHGRCYHNTGLEDGRTELLRLLGLEWEKNNRKSFGAILADLCYAAEGHSDIATCDDVKLLKALRQGGVSRKL